MNKVLDTMHLFILKLKIEKQVCLFLKLYCTPYFLLLLLLMSVKFASVCIVTGKVFGFHPRKQHQALEMTGC